jgi:hypothetical protein
MACTTQASGWEHIGCFQGLVELRCENAVQATSVLTEPFGSAQNKPGMRDRSPGTQLRHRPESDH